ncbi:MAG: stage II sporulation protein P [Oscillospiraceae bacterium]|nr:stage II sporulation protein P [Oscillospiraceae bacterium]
MQRRKRPINGRMFAVSAVMVLGAAMLSGLFYTMPVLSDAMRRAAVVSVAVAMPDISLDLFEERLRTQIYGGEIPGVIHESTPFLPAPEPLPADPPVDIPPQNPLLPEIHAPSMPAPAAPQNPVRIPRVPERYAAPIINENFAGRDGGGMLRHDNIFIRNETDLSPDGVLDILEEPMPLEFHADGRPQVLIVHTHATESYERYDSEFYDIRNTWRSTDNNINVVALGTVMRDVLEEYGIGVIHDTTQHDFPSYNGSYERAARTIKGYLEDYNDIQVVLDLHRDAMPRGDAIIKPVTMVGDRKAAQIMIISGSDNGSLNMPNWRDNFRFAAAFQSYMEMEARELTRPIYLSHRRYNMDITTGSLLVEIGSNANTLEEAKLSAELAAHALAALIIENSINTSP